MEELSVLIIIIFLLVFKALIRKGANKLSGETKLKIVFGLFVVVSLVSSLLGLFSRPFGVQEIGLSLFNAILSAGFWCLIYLAIKKKFFKKEELLIKNDPVQPPGGAISPKLNVKGDALKIFLAFLIGVIFFVVYIILK